MLLYKPQLLLGLGVWWILDVRRAWPSWLGILIANDNDASGTLIFSVSSASNLTLPVHVRCQFNATGTVTSDDFIVQVQEVTQNNAPGDPAILTLGLDVH